MSSAAGHTMSFPLDLPRCSELVAEDLADVLRVVDVQLPAPLPDTCGSALGVRGSCRHGFYAATPHSDSHALLYNDASGDAVLVLFNGSDAIAKTRILGTEEARGLQFDPSARHLVALLSGGTGVPDAPSFFVKLRVPSLEVLWARPIESPLVGMEQWTPDNADAIAVSEERYVLHSAGVCRAGRHCAGLQGDLMQVLNATTGERLSLEGRDWQTSHACKQMIAYNSASDTFLMASAGDAHPKGLLFTGFSRGAHLESKPRFESWGDEHGRQGVTQGALKADPEGRGFVGVWSYAPEDGGLDKLHLASFGEDIGFSRGPEQVFPDNGRSEIGGNLAPLGGGRWLLAYTEAPAPAIADRLRTHFDDWGISQDVRGGGSRLAILDAAVGAVVGAPVNISALGARLPVELGHLVERPDGVGWASIGGPGAASATLVHVRCLRSGARRGPHDGGGA